MKPISDKKIEAWRKDWSRILLEARTGQDKAFLLVLRELQRVRAELRIHKQAAPKMAWDHNNTKLYQATLPEGER